MIYLELIYRFFLTGLFSVGGGLATLPFLYEMSNTTHWFSHADIADMIAVSESTPGAIGINMATYAGFKTAGVPGGICATVGLAAPSIIIILIIAQFLKKFRDSKAVNRVFYGLRPASIAMITAAGLNVAVVSYDEDSRFYLRKEGLLMAYTGEWSADFNDPDNFIYTFFGSRAKSLYRSSNFSDEQVIRRIARARTLQDEEERLREYAELEKILIQDEAVWVPLFSTSHLFILGKRLESFTPFWAGWGSLYLKDIVLKPEAR